MMGSYYRIGHDLEKSSMVHTRRPSPHGLSGVVRRYNWKYAASFIIGFVLLLQFLSTLPSPSNTSDDQHPENLQANASNECSSDEPSCWNTTSKYAYATLLGRNVHEEHEINDDNYFISTRLLAYQLLHASETRTTHDYPLIVLVSPAVSESKKERSRRDGAIVWEREELDVDWCRVGDPGFKTAWSKLHLWELTQFDRIAFFDADTVLTQAMDNLFEDPAVQIPQFTSNDKGGIRTDEEKQPSEYVFAAIQEPREEHGFPPTDEHNDWYNKDYLNAGFFVMKPSLDMFNYFKSVMAIPYRFKEWEAEQNLLNYAFRHDGNMPWTVLNPIYNQHSASMNDLEHGVQSLHSKFWKPIDEKLLPYLQSWRWRMEGFYEAWNQQSSR